MVGEPHDWSTPLYSKTYKELEARVKELEAANENLHEQRGNDFLSRQARIAELEIEVQICRTSARLVLDAAERDRARLAAVITLCDGPHDNCGGYREDALNETGCYVSPALLAVRAAATGDAE